MAKAIADLIAATGFTEDELLHMAIISMKNRVRDAWAATDDAEKRKRCASMNEAYEALESRYAKRIEKAILRG